MVTLPLPASLIFFVFGEITVNNCLMREMNIDGWYPLHPLPALCSYQKRSGLLHGPLSICRLGKINIRRLPGMVVSPGDLFRIISMC